MIFINYLFSIKYKGFRIFMYKLNKLYSKLSRLLFAIYKFFCCNFSNLIKLSDYENFCILLRDLLISMNTMCHFLIERVYYFNSIVDYRIFHNKELN